MIDTVSKKSNELIVDIDLKIYSFAVSINRQQKKIESSGKKIKVVEAMGEEEAEAVIEVVIEINFRIKSDLINWMRLQKNYREARTPDSTKPCLQNNLSGQYLKQLVTIICSDQRRVHELFDNQRIILCLRFSHFNNFSYSFLFYSRLYITLWCDGLFLDIFDYVLTLQNCRECFFFLQRDIAI